MNIVKIFLFVEVIVSIVTGAKVDVKGKVAIGEDVVDMIAYHLRNNKDCLKNRRFLDPPPIEDPITLAVKEAQTCKQLKLCQNNLQYFVNEYVDVLAKAAASVLNIEYNDQKYVEQIKQSLKHIRNILEDADAKYEEEDKVYYWTHVVKKINAKFQKLTNTYGPDIEDPGTANNTQETGARHKIVIANAFIERKYLMKLCSEHGLCSKSHQCTKALNKFLIHFKTMPEDRIRTFIKYFYEALFVTPFYSYLKQSTANDFQIILNDMVYANDTSTRDIMLSVLKTAEARMNMIELNTGFVVAHDILLAHAILSDIDHMFSKHTNAFTMFLNKFYDWLASDVRIEKTVRAVLSDIATQISLSEPDLVQKLIDEVTVFLDITISASK